MNLDKIDLVFEIKKRSNVNLDDCYQCGKCSAGCPVIISMEYPPSYAIRLIQLGFNEKVLRSLSMWQCASCETCTTRCPQDIDFAKVQDALRELAIEYNVAHPKSYRIRMFYKSFLETIKHTGRAFELGMVGIYKGLTGTFFQDVLLAPAMFIKGKLKLLPHVIKGRKSIKEIFRKSKK